MATPDIFTTNKRAVIGVLGQEDKSRKGSIDVQIRPLLDHINAFAHHYTTSSCAGRFLVMGLPADRKKEHAVWLYASHDVICATDVIDALAKANAACDASAESIVEVWFKCEPPILHVCSRTVEDACLLLEAARSAGLKRSGIISIREGKVMSEIIGTFKCDVPLVLDGRRLSFADAYLEELCEHVTKQLARSRKIFDKLMDVRL